MSGTRADARKSREAALFDEPRSDDPICCEMHGRVLTALRKVYGSSDITEAMALADALEDEGLLCE